MAERSMNRRDFDKLTAAALGGLLAGASLGCGSAPPAPQASANGVASEKHLCRGLNECAGQGADGKNDCRGQGTCATAAHHECGGQNTCKGLGGCGETAGANDCKGQGLCAVPLMDHAWETVRGRMEARWKEKGLEYGKPPAVKM